MMVGQDMVCWEERIHKEEDALQDFMQRSASMPSLESTQET